MGLRFYDEEVRDRTDIRKRRLTHIQKRRGWNFIGILREAGKWFEPQGRRKNGRPRRSSKDVINEAMEKEAGGHRIGKELEL